jgi:hypothetical protein
MRCSFKETRCLEVLRRTDWQGISAVLLDRRLPEGDVEKLLPRLRQLAPFAGGW